MSSTAVNHGLRPRFAFNNFQEQRGTNKEITQSPSIEFPAVSCFPMQGAGYG